MRELVIGVDGFIGRRMLDLTGAEGTSRGNPCFHGHHHLDLLGFSESDLPKADMVYLCAGVNGAMKCAGNQESYRVNVDATIRLAQHYSSSGSFLVWLSSTSVEWSIEAYARQKAMAETAIRMLPSTGIIRAGRVVRSNLDDLCHRMIAVGRTRTSGVTLWGEDERPYDK
jgi:dTDP-4-dehydrorhamnose reductase